MQFFLQYEAQTISFVLKWPDYVGGFADARNGPSVGSAPTSCQIRF